jgi:sodium transport system permease protein
MRWRIALTIFRKELLETLRDRRTLVVMLILPLVLYPILLIGFTQVATHQVSQLNAMTGIVAVVGEIPPELSALLEADKEKPDKERLHLELIRVPGAPLPPATLVGLGDDLSTLPPIYTEWADAAFRDDTADAVLLIAHDTPARLAAGDTSATVLLYDATIEESRTVNDRTVKLLQAYREEIITNRLAARPDLSEGFFRPLPIYNENIAPPRKRGGYLAGRILPMILIMMVLLGAFYPAVDLTAGEKERGTMQTLLTAPAMPLEIIFGKFMTVFLVSMASAMANLGSMAAAFAWLVKDIPGEYEIAFHMSMKTVGIVFLQLIPIALLFSALMMAVAVFARSYKEAQNYLTPVYVLIIIPVAMVGMPGVKLVGFTAGVPVLNVLLLMRELLTTPPPLEVMTMVLIANIGYSILALVLAVRVFTSEQVLLAGQNALGDAFRIRTNPTGPNYATPMLSLSVFCVGLVVLLYLGTIVQQTNLVWGMVVTQWILLLVPVLLVVKMMKLDFKETLMLRRPPLWGTLAAIILGLSSWVVLGSLTTWFQNYFLEAPPALEKMMEEALGLTGTPHSTWVLLAVFAISPGICEEFLFRGLILSGFRRTMGRWPAILIVSVMFGIFHISIYRILPTMVIGIIVTLVVYQTRSIWTGILLHVINNSMLLLLSKHGDLPLLPNPVPDGAIAWPVMTIYIVAFIVGIWILMASTREATVVSSVPIGRAAGTS